MKALTEQSIYQTEDGQPVSTHSMLKTFRRCAMQTKFKYVDRLKPKTVSKPLKRGTWFHRLLEVHYKGEDWKAEHQRMATQFAELFDEERDYYGDLPGEMKRLMASYIWHYEADPWKIHEVEFTLETELPNGHLYRGKIDLLIENQWGLWIVDHKTHKSLPDVDFRILDAQSALYVWAAIKNKIPVQGHIWNYIVAKGPSEPALLKSGDRLSRAKCLTDFPTLSRTVKKHGLDLEDYRPWLTALKRQRFSPERVQSSSFFRRDIMEKNKGMLKIVAAEALMTSKRMHSYPFNGGVVERVPDKSCGFMCSYTDICTAELLTGEEATNVRRQQYTVGDPLSYYDDADPERSTG